jgi:hypothetical protein
MKLLTFLLIIFATGCASEQYNFSNDQADVVVYRSGCQITGGNLYNKTDQPRSLRAKLLALDEDNNTIDSSLLFCETANPGKYSLCNYAEGFTSSVAGFACRKIQNLQLVW